MDDDETGARRGRARKPGWREFKPARRWAVTSPMNAIAGSQ
jgi:hypothetical protein